MSYQQLMLMNIQVTNYNDKQFLQFHKLQFKSLI